MKPNEIDCGNRLKKVENYSRVANEIRKTAAKDGLFSFRFVNALLSDVFGERLSEIDAQDAALACLILSDLLPVPDQRIFVLRYGLGLTRKRIAEIEDVHPNQVQQVLAHGLRQLRRPDNQKRLRAIVIRGLPQPLY